MRERCLVIIPTYNEVLNITTLVRSLIRSSDSIDVLIIDDSSPDGTAQVVRTEFLSDRRITVLSRRSKLGIGSAYIMGFKYALESNYGMVMQMDADFSHKPAYVPDLLEAMKDNDLAIASRYVKEGGVKNWSKTRRLISMFGLMAAKIILGLPIRDLTGGFKCFRCDIFKKIDLDKIESSGYFFQVEMNYLTYLLGRKIIEIPYVFDDTRVGQTRLSRAQAFKTFLRLPRLRLTGRDHPAIKDLQDKIA